MKNNSPSHFNTRAVHDACFQLVSQPLAGHCLLGNGLIIHIVLLRHSSSTDGPEIKHMSNTDKGTHSDKVRTPNVQNPSPTNEKTNRLRVMWACTLLLRRNAQEWKDLSELKRYCIVVSNRVRNIAKTCYWHIGVPSEWSYVIIRVVLIFWSLKFLCCSLWNWCR